PSRMLWPEQRLGRTTRASDEALSGYTAASESSRKPYARNLWRMLPPAQRSPLEVGTSALSIRANASRILDSHADVQAVCAHSSRGAGRGRDRFPPAAAAGRLHS